jgi:hypothetical protein
LLWRARRFHSIQWVDVALAVARAARYAQSSHLRTLNMKTGMSICLFACTGLLTTMGAVAAGGQSPGVVSHYGGMFGNTGYVHGPTPELAYAPVPRLDQRAIQNLALIVEDLTGAPAVQACKGFRKVGDCVAAAHVSQNLGVSFTSLRESMRGKHGQQLTSAIQALRPDVDSGLEATRALQQVHEDISRT